MKLPMLGCCEESDCGGVCPVSNCKLYLVSSTWLAAGDSKFYYYLCDAATKIVKHRGFIVEEVTE